MSAIVVGSGVIGSYVANTLLSAGKGPVTLLEAGPIIPMADAASWFHVVTGGDAPYTQCYDEPGDFEAKGDNPWNIVGGRILGRGGSTLHWGGWVPRFKPEDFAMYSNTGQGIDWPYGYKELESYYCQAEQYLGVAGDSNEQDPPRSQPFPFTPAAYPLMMGPVIEAMQSLGMSYRQMPVARYGEGETRQTPCMTTGTCKYCPVGGRYTGDQTVDDLLGNSDFLLILNAPALEINMSAKNTASGVTYLDTTTGIKRSIEADTIFICAGALETPKLLQNSKQYWANGIGNDYGLVGRYLMASPYFYANGTLAKNPQKMESELGFPSLCSRYFDTPQYQKAGKFFFNADYANPNLKVSSLMAQGKTMSDILTAAMGQAQYSLQGTMAAIPQYNNQVSSAPGNTRFGLPKTLINTPDPLYDANQATFYMKQMANILTTMGCSNVGFGSYPQRGDHAMGTCRMATTEQQGVVDPNLKVYGVDNLYVMGHATFPSMGAVNPTLTLLAATMKAMQAFGA